MASVYRVKNKQNIFDISIQLYGSIEGIFDLLITNEDLSMDEVIEEGRELLYHPEYILQHDIVDAINKEDILIANGEGEEPFLHGTDVLGAISLSITNRLSVKIMAAGSGQVQVDWGDSCIKEYVMSSIEQPLVHQYAAKGTYNVIIYGGTVTALDMRGMSGKFYPIKAKNTLEKYCEDGNLLASASCISMLSNTLLHHFEWKNRSDALALHTYLNAKQGLQYLDVTGSNISMSSVASFVSNINSNISAYTSLTCYFDSTQVNTTARNMMRTIVGNSTYGSRYKFFVNNQRITA